MARPVRGLALMPFGNSWWQDGDGDGFLRGGVFAQARPAADGLPDGPRAGTSAALGTQAAARLVVKPFCQLGLLPILQQVIAQSEHEPERPQEFQQFAEAHP